MVQTLTLALAIALADGGPKVAAAGWKAGASRAVITPKRLLWLSGYASRDKPAEGTLHDLWLKALALEDASGRRAVLVTADLIGFSKSIYDNVCGRVQSRFGLGRDAILLTASHTHCGPVISDSLMDLYPIDAEQGAWIDEYTRELEDTVVAVVAQAIEKLKPAQVSAGTGVARFAVNRRNNPEPEVPARRAAGTLVGPIDHAVPVLAVKDAAGKLETVVFGYACHNTTLAFFQFCGDYAGFAQIELERSQPGVQAMFFTGCGGDQNPLPRRTVELCAGYGKNLADAVEDVLRQPLASLDPVLETNFAFLDLPLGNDVPRDQLEARAKGTDYVARWARRLLASLETGKAFPRSYPYPIVVWRLGKKQWWIALGGEVVVDYSVRLKRELGDDIWVTAYANDVMAYIPSARVLAEGGYEGQSSMIGYGMAAERWGPRTEELLIAEVHRLVDQVKDAGR